MSFNIDKWAQFLKQVDEKKPAQVRVTIDTMEGGFIFQELYYDGQLIHYSFDNSRDAMGIDVSNSKICTGFGTISNDKGPVLVLAGCDNESDGSLAMWKDINQYKETDIVKLFDLNVTSK